MWKNVLLEIIQEQRKEENVKSRHNIACFHKNCKLKKKKLSYSLEAVLMNANV